MCCFKNLLSPCSRQFDLFFPRLWNQRRFSLIFSFLYVLHTAIHYKFQFHLRASSPLFFYIFPPPPFCSYYCSRFRTMHLLADAKIDESKTQQNQKKKTMLFVIASSTFNQPFLPPVQVFTQFSPEALFLYPISLLLRIFSNKRSGFLPSFNFVACGS